MEAKDKYKRGREWASGASSESMVAIRGELELLGSGEQKRDISYGCLDGGQGC